MKKSGYTEAQDLSTLCKGGGAVAGFYREHGMMSLSGGRGLGNR